MARKKIKEPTPFENAYYVHYNKDTGIILSVNNYRNDDYTDAIEITADQHDRFCTGKDEFSDFVVGIVIDENGKDVHGLISQKLVEEYNFKNKLLIWIDDELEDADITVHWDEANAEWVFVASDELRQRYYDNKIPLGSISFFVTLGKEPNFLIRTISIVLKDLVFDKIKIPFESSWEKNIETISMTSNLINLQYSLKIWRIT